MSQPDEHPLIESLQQPKDGRQHGAMRLAGALLAAILLLALGYGSFRTLAARNDDGPPAGVKTYDYTSGQHTRDSVAYTESPPVGGAHNPVWQTCGFYDGVIANENAVHSLEHGAVWITYTPDISADDKAKLAGWAKEQPYLLVSEYTDQKTPFVFTAWNNQLAVDSLTDEKATQFMNYFIQGPQTPERGATCSGGVTETVG